MQGNVDHVRPLTIDEVSRIHFRGGSHIGISRANPTKNPEHLENTVISLLRLNVSQLITIGGDDTAFSAMKLAEKAAGPHPRRARAEDDRQRPRPARLRRHLRLPDRAPHRRRDREEPDGRRQDHVALVLRDRDGAQGRPPRARHRQGRRRDAHADPRGVPGAAASGSRRSWTRSWARSSSASATGGATASRSSPRGWCSASRSRRPRAARGRRARRPRPRAHRRGQHRRDPEGAGAGAAPAVRDQDHDRGQEHRLRAALRRSDPVRHGVHARPRLLRGQVPARGRQRGDGLDAGRALRAGAVRRDARSEDRQGARSAWWTSARRATRSRAAT